MSTGTDGTKIIQTEVSRSEYERLQKLAEQEGYSLKRLLREAAREYGDRHLQYDPDDPLFTATPAESQAETDARDVDDRLARTLSEDEDVDE